MEHKSAFIDEIIITISSGAGGAGAVSFLRERNKNRGAPNGGNGGNGGSVYFQAQSAYKTFAHLHRNKKYKAQSGIQGASNNKQGASGEDLIISVPKGTVIKNFETQDVILDIADSSEKKLLLSGARGGKGNAFFTTSRRRSPRFAQPGMPGIELTIKLELSIFADIGFVGYPNAGKSTLLSVLSNARPRIAEYPFTTRYPNLGIMTFHHQEIILADIPGIIEGASIGAGLGHRFLKHISRVKALAYIIEISQDDNFLNSFRLLQSELRKYNPLLLEKRFCVIASKADLVPTKTVEQILKYKSTEFGNAEFLVISSKSRYGIQELYKLFFELCEE